MNSEQKYSVNDEGYFGISFLKLDTYGAHLVSNTITNTYERGSRLWFDDVTPFYEADKKALTVEGIARTKSTPEFAVQALSAYAKVARDMDALAEPFAS